MKIQTAFNEPVNRKLWNHLSACNEGYDPQTALICGERRISYQELFTTISKAADGFRDVGVGEGDVVPVFSLSTPETVGTLYALNRIGAVSAWVDIKATDQEIRRCIEESGARLIVAVELCLQKVLRNLDGTQVETVVVLPIRPYLSEKVKQTIFQENDGRVETKNSKCVSWEDMLSFEKHDHCADTSFREQMPAVIAYTGGTTGIPKGVLLSNESFNTVAEQYRIQFSHFRRGQKMLTLLPPFAVYGLCVSIHVPLCLGITTVLVPLFRPQDFAKYLLLERPNHVNGTTSFWEALLHSKEAKNEDFSFLLSPGTGGDGMTVELEEKVNQFLAGRNASCRLLKGYGMTEVCAAACLCTEESNEPGSVGFPLPGNEIRIANPDTGQELPPGEIGEILICSRAVMLGYLHNEKETQDLLKRDREGKLWVHTKDVGYLNENGALFVVGRLKRMFTRSGLKIYPSVIENLLAEHKAVQSCAVVGVMGIQGETVPRAYVVLWDEFTDRAPQIRGELAALCRADLNQYQIPDKIIFLKALPKTNLGKVDFRSLEQENSALGSEGDSL